MNTLGRLFRVTLLGTSHGPGVGVVVEGCPPGIPLSEGELEASLSRRRGGRPGTTARVEPDVPAFLSGVHRGHTTGQPLLVWFENRDVGPPAPPWLPRPGHADLAATLKYGGWQDPRGGGAFSGRLTVGWVAAGALASKLLHGVCIEAEVSQVGGREDLEAATLEAREAGDSVGGLIQCRATGVPAGWGEPLADPLDGRLAQAMFTIPGIRAFEVGDGFAMAALRGSQANDPILDATGRTRTEHNGGVSGGMSNGNDLVFRVAVRPTPSISLPQDTVDLLTGQPATVRSTGRNDACFALRLPVVVESMTACVLADFHLLHRALGRPDGCASSSCPSC